MTQLQRWALSYLMVEDRKEKAEAEDRQYKMLLSIHKPEIYAAVVEAEGALGDGSGEEGFSTDNISEIEAYLQEVGGQQFATAADDDEEVWA